MEKKATYLAIMNLAIETKTFTTNCHGIEGGENASQLLKKDYSLQYLHNGVQTINCNFATNLYLV